MAYKSRTEGTRHWAIVDYQEVPGDFIRPIYFRILKTEEVGSVRLQLTREGRIKIFTLKTTDPSKVMDLLKEKCKKWDQLCDKQDNATL